MKAKSSAHYQREYRKRLREQGLVKKEVWIRPEHAKQLSAVEKALRTMPGQDLLMGEPAMSKELNQWTTESLYSRLAQSDLVNEGRASIESIDGIEPTLHIVMHEYGDLPVFLTVSGEQVIVESVLWSVSDVQDVAQFNEAILRTHKYFPLSTISLDAAGDGKEYYSMFGALSAASLLQNVILEIEILATNVIQATEAYGEFLTITDESITAKA